MIVGGIDAPAFAIADMNQVVTDICLSTPRNAREVKAPQSVFIQM